MEVSLKFYTAREAAEILRVSFGTLANWRMTGEGPKWIKVGKKKVLYPEAMLREFAAGYTNRKGGKEA